MSLDSLIMGKCGHFCKQQGGVDRSGGSAVQQRGRNSSAMTREKQLLPLIDLGSDSVMKIIHVK